MVAELDRDADPLEREDGLAAEVAGDRVGGVVEVAAVVDRPWHVRTVLEQEELDLGVDVEGEAAVGGLRQRAAQDVARVGPGRAPSGVRMSQNMRADSPMPRPSNGKTWNVVGSGMATMSDS
ncbi:hypothetical protein GCM10029992_32040 [Glycomyces albus]